jgi:hypothetical protein
VSNSKKKFAPCLLNPHPLVMSPPPLAIFLKMSQDFVFSDSCTRVHGFEEETRLHVPGYMDLKKKQNSMYPGYMDLKKKQDYMYVHGFEEETKFHVTGYMDLKKKQNSVHTGK